MTSDLDNLFIIASHMMNIYAKFHKIPPLSREVASCERREFTDNERTTEKHNASRRLLLSVEASNAKQPISKSCLVVKRNQTSNSI